MPTLSPVAEDARELERRVGRYLDEMLDDPRARDVLLAFFAYHLKPQSPTDKIQAKDEYYRYRRAQAARLGITRGALRVTICVERTR